MVQTVDYVDRFQASIHKPWYEVDGVDVHPLAEEHAKINQRHSRAQYIGEISTGVDGMQQWQRYRQIGIRLYVKGLKFRRLNMTV